MKCVWDKSDDSVDRAARIWADATATRDRDPDPGPLSLARPVIERALSQAGETDLISALDSDGQTVGFALTVALPTGVELYFLGVAPGAWGHGVGTALLNELAGTVSGGSGLELWVYEDNRRAIAVYERAGWHHDGSTRMHPRSGKVEHHYVRP